MATREGRDAGRDTERDAGRSRSFVDLLGRYVDALQRGEVLDPDAIRAEHPAEAAALLETLEDFADLGRAAEEVPLGTLGDYRLERVIGRGGMGVVYEAWECSMDRRVALKVLPAALAADERSFDRFLREAKAAGRLSHPSIVAVHSFGVKERVPYFAMDFVEGETLAEVLAREREEGRAAAFGSRENMPVYANSAAAAFAGVADGLHHAHAKGVTHRDIKPSNLILERPAGPLEETADGGAAPRLRILDFGLARLEGQESLTATGDLLGTPLYMSPEQARRRKIAVDHRTDVYSLGATLYEVLTLRPPFRGRDHQETLSHILTRDPEPLRRLDPRIPRDLETIVLKCLRKEPEDRYRTAEALAQDLRRFARGDAVEARPEAAWERLLRRLHRLRREILVAGLVLVLAAAALALGLSARRAERARRLAAYRPAVQEVLERLARGRFSLEAARGTSAFQLGSGGRALSPLGSEDFRKLAAGASTQGFAAAVAELAAIARALPEERDAHYHLARSYDLLARRAEARREARSALALDRDFVPARVLLAELSGEPEGGAGRRLEALAELGRRAAAGGAGGAWQAAWLEAERALSEKNWQAAAAACSRLLELRHRGPEAEPYIGCFAETFLKRGVTRLGAREPLLAQEDFSHAEALAPGLEPRLLIGTAYHRAGLEEEAERTLRRLHEEAPPAAREGAALWITLLYDSLGDYGKALEWTRGEFGRSPLRPRLEAFFLKRLGDDEEAIARAREAISRDPEELIAHQVLAVALLERLWAGTGGDRERELALLLDAAREAAWLDPRPEGLSARLLAAAEAERKNEALRLERRKLMTTSDAKDAVRLAARTGALGALVTVAAASGRGGEDALDKGTFDDVVPVTELNSPATEWWPAISHGGRTLIFGSDRAGGRGGSDLYMAQREEPEGPFTAIRNLEEINSTSREDEGSLSADGRELFFDSDRSGGAGGFDIYLARREDPEDPGEPFGAPSPLALLNGPRGQAYPWSTADGRELYYYDYLPERRGVWVARRAGPGAEFETPPERVFFTGWVEHGPTLSADGLTLFFADWWPLRPGGLGELDIWMVSRSRREDPFPDAPVNLGAPVNTPVCEGAPSISADWPAEGATLYILRSTACEAPDVDIYQATWHVIPPPPRERFRRGDPNNTGTVDLTDAVATFRWLFAGFQLACIASADTDDSGTVELTDGIRILNWLFRGGPAPEAPFAACGEDPTPDTLGCKEYACP